LRVPERCEPEEKAAGDEETAVRWLTTHRALLLCASNREGHAGRVARGGGLSPRRAAIIA